MCHDVTECWNCLGVSGKEAIFIENVVDKAF
jgi:hypothetical protein